MKAHTVRTANDGKGQEEEEEEERGRGGGREGRRPPHTLAGSTASGMLPTEASMKGMAFDSYHFLCSGFPVEMERREAAVESGETSFVIRSSFHIVNGQNTTDANLPVFKVYEVKI